jgi:hypothetical protein
MDDELLHEEQLRRVYWKDLSDKGAKYGRFQKDADSAWNIVDLVPLDRPIIPRVIRKELEIFRSGLLTETGNAGLWSLLKKLLGCAQFSSHLLSRDLTPSQRTSEQPEMTTGRMANRNC